MIQVYEGDGVRRIDVRYALMVLSENDESDIMQGEIDLDFETMTEDEVKAEIEQKLARAGIRFNRDLGVGEPWPHVVQVYGSWA